MYSGTGNDQYPLMEYELAGFIHKMMVLFVDPTCIPNRFNVGDLLRPWKLEKLPLKEASESGLARDFSHYFAVGGSVLAQQFYTVARRCIRSIVVAVGKGKTERAENSPNVALVFPSLIRQGNRERLGEMVLHFGSALAARGVLTDAELGKLVPQ